MKNKKKNQIKSPQVFTLGELDLKLSINFRDEDLEKKSESGNEKEYYNIMDFEGIKDLSFLKDNKKIINHVKISSKHEILKLLLIGNRNREKPSLIDYIPLGFPHFQEDEQFFNNILKDVTEKNGLILNDKPLNMNGKYAITIEMKHKDKTKTITLGVKERDEHEKDNDIAGEGDSPPEGEQKEEIIEDDEDEYGDYEPNEMMKAGYIPKFRRKKSILCNLCPKSPKYEFVYFNFEDLNKINGNYKLEDMYELLDFFRKKKTVIFINYFKKEEEKKGEEKKEEEKKEEEKKEEKKEEEKKEEEKKEEEKKEEEKKEEKKKEDENKELGKNEDQNANNNKELGKNKQENNDPSDEMILLNKFYYITDIYFFDKKQALKIFDEHYKAFTKDKPKKTINSRNIFDYFVKGIATGTCKEVPLEKTGLFLDEFNKFIIIQVTKNSVNKSEFDPQPFPKINTHNINEVNEYKSIISKNKKDFYMLFLSEVVTNMGCSAPKCSTPEVIIPSFLNGVELVKRKLELIKNDIKVKDEEKFYKIKKDPKLMAEQIDKLAKGQKEGNFKLDCTNLITSNKKEYVSLYDYHLKNFFSREANRKELKNKGFINSKGYIKYDPVYRNVMGTKKNNKKTYTEKELKRKIISTIKDINIPNRLDDKEINCEKVALNEKDVTNIKIPFKVEKRDKSLKKKRNVKKSGSNEGSSSNSEGSVGENQSK